MEPHFYKLIVITSDSMIQTMSYPYELMGMNALQYNQELLNVQFVNFFLNMRTNGMYKQILDFFDNTPPHFNQIMTQEYLLSLGITLNNYEDNLIDLMLNYNDKIDSVCQAADANYQFKKDELIEIQEELTSQQKVYSKSAVHIPSMITSAFVSLTIMYGLDSYLDKIPLIEMFPLGKMIQYITIPTLGFSIFVGTAVGSAQLRYEDIKKSKTNRSLLQNSIYGEEVGLQTTLKKMKHQYEDDVDSLNIGLKSKVIELTTQEIDSQLFIPA